MYSFKKNVEKVLEIAAKADKLVEEYKTDEAVKSLWEMVDIINDSSEDFQEIIKMEERWNLS